MLNGRPGFIPTPLIFQASAIATLLAALKLLFTRGGATQLLAGVLPRE